MAAATVDRNQFRQDRVKRAAEQMADYNFEHHPAVNLWICRKRDGRFYVIGEEGCSCPDYQYRAASVGSPCKHIVALRLHQLMESRR